jgi:hypothetical protein
MTPAVFPWAVSRPAGSLAEAGKIEVSLARLEKEAGNASSIHPTHS